MVILAFDSSAKAASVALCRDGQLISQYYQASGLTHSRTLLPMAEDLLKNADMTLKDVDAVAVAHGPGSFTGVRIGVSAVKGLCWGLDIPAIGVSTLEAMAYNGECAPEGSIICCAMDARRNQVYNALFVFEGGELKRLSPDRAIGLDELSAELGEMKKTVFVVGDGAQLCYNYLDKCGISAILAPENTRNQTAWGVCRAAQNKEAIPARDIIPVYLRLSQAERERLEKLKEN
ncbi:MAG: tRNA (adenosine(37)-N6)-threonylcarbamoyltransferase complex dimerization subunit type 1 TsaB [Oscillospiraceae bacterium]|nr:tRNA (adenosine(37)-N6)-threonylcarbamoyltransferase complex dimerization subunit type 1 TsaB [Oscillospiraceae bacterium]MBR5260900.1 tRNA (adenosine(37)-N6)-threonylcarbamoyltransferase complex dimerization subunit type 1 TsaB [Oscillospiraceae bacterium]